MNKLTLTYIDFELGKIFPENLPMAVCGLLNEFSNEYLIEIAGMNKPTYYDLQTLTLKAFEINELDSITPYEKIDLMLDQYEKATEINIDFYHRLEKFNNEAEKKLYFLEQFISIGLSDYWTPSDECDYIFEKTREELKDLRINNKYKAYS